MNNIVLAESEWLEFLPFLVFVVISIVAGIAKNAQKKEKRSPRSSFPVSRRHSPREPEKTLSLDNLEKEAPEWIHVPGAAPPIPAAAAKTSGFKHHHNDAKHPTPVQSDSHVYREVADVPLHETAHGERTIHVNLMGPERLRRAMVMHEIFSPPLALREERPLWDE